MRLICQYGCKSSSARLLGYGCQAAKIMNDPNVRVSRPNFLPWIFIAMILVGLIWRFAVPKQAADSDGRRPVGRGSSSDSHEIDPVPLARAVYVRFVEDESDQPPATKLSRAIDGVARSRSLQPAEVRDALNRYSASIEEDLNRGPEDRALAATLRGDFVAAASLKPLATSSTRSIASGELELPDDWLLARINSINLAIGAGRHVDAEAAIADASRLIDRQHDAERWTRLQASLFYLRHQQNKLDEALTIAREVVAWREKNLASDSPGLGSALHNLGVCLESRDQHKEAAGALARAVTIYEKAYGPDDMSVAGTASELAAALSEGGDLPAAEAAAKKAIRIFARAPADWALPLALAMDRLGFTLLQAQRPAEAEAPLRGAVEIYDRQPKARAKDHADSVHRLGLAIARQDRRREALPYLKRSTEIAAKWFAHDDPLYAVYFHNYAVWADGAGDDEATVLAYEKAVNILAKNQRRTGKAPPQLAQSREFYAAYLQRAGVSASEATQRVEKAMSRP